MIAWGIALLPLVGLIAQLLFFHVLLIRDDITTYEYIIREQERGQERQQRAADGEHESKEAKKAAAAARRQRREEELEKDNARRAELEGDGDDDAPAEIFDDGRPPGVEGDEGDTLVVARDPRLERASAEPRTPSAAPAASAGERGGDVKLMFTSEPAAYATTLAASEPRRADELGAPREADDDGDPLQCGMPAGASGPASGLTGAVQDARESIESLMGGECLGAKQTTDGSETPI